MKICALVLELERRKYFFDTFSDPQTFSKNGEICVQNSSKLITPLKNQK